MKAGIDNPQTEIRTPKEIRKPNPEAVRGTPGSDSDFGARSSFGLRASVFGILASALCLLTSVFCPPAFAQGTAFTYQGRLNNGANPAAGIYDLRFTIYDSTNNPGVVVAGPLTNTAIAVSNGLFTVLLDFGAGVFTGAERWLEIGVRPDGSGTFTTLSPRQPITATPYAITASNLTGTVAASQLIGSISSNNIGAGSITRVMLAAGAVGQNQLADGAVTTAALADGAVTSAKMAVVAVTMSLTTFTNPTPAAGDNFGTSVAPMGTDRVLIGTPYENPGGTSAGAAYLLSTNGTLLITFTNPTPAASDLFGYSVAAVGNNHVLIGAYQDDTGANNSGAAYLFHTNGTLLTTLTNPTPAASDLFGHSVAAVGSDRVLVGAQFDGTGAMNAGAAYLFRTNGTLLTTLTNPTPEVGDSFGASVAAMGTDRVLIGAYSDNTGAPFTGAAYLLRTNGALLTTFTNPTPVSGDFFGYSVAAVGTDRVLIGAYGDNTGAPYAGAAYLFSTNGTLLTTFTNPTPAEDERFGFSVAAAGSGRVLIGAYQDSTGGTFSGTAYLYNTNGILLTTLTNPTPATSDLFGYSVAALGSGRVLIGAYGDNTGATDAGAAYLFTLDTFTPGLVADAVRFGGITSESLGAGSVSSYQLAAGAVGSNQLAAGAVGSYQLATGAVTTTALANDAVTAGNVAMVTVTLSLTSITNPNPAVDISFGYPVAALGNDRALIGAFGEDTGAPNAGVVYLFGANGTLLTTFTNPTPVTDDNFGISVGVMGSDRVLVGARNDDTGAFNAGAAYLFGTNGTLLTTFTNPTPAQTENFGNSLAAVGNDRVLVSVPNNNAGGGNFGVAYLFSTNGALLTTITNPAPGSAAFGASVAALGSDRVLISAAGEDTGAAGAGVAYLFSINGILLTTFTNPTPAIGDGFGNSVAALGSDRVLIGAADDDTGAVNAGAAYLFSTNGILLTTFTNPTPQISDQFGDLVAAAGSDRVLIGAFSDNTGATDAGAAYLFTTNGTLLTTFTNPTPASIDSFGDSVAAMGSDRVLISALGDDTVAPNAGAAYLFTTNGALLTTFTNLTPAVIDLFGNSVATLGSEHVLVGAPEFSSVRGTVYLFDGNGSLVTNFFSPTSASHFFGSSVAAVGTDRVLIGAFGDDTGAMGTGAAYLYATNDTLLTVFTNPTPAVSDSFGISVAALGSEHVLIGANGDDTGGTNAGAAYLFTTGGTLLTTFTNPAAAVGDVFGSSVAAVGSDRVLIGANGDDTGATDAGAVYLFSTNGTLLATFINPTPASLDNFGASVAAVGSDGVLIGAYLDDTGAGNAGAAYLFSTNGTLLTTFTDPLPVIGGFFGSSVAAAGTEQVLIGAYGHGTGKAYLFRSNGTLLFTFTNPAAPNELFGFAVSAESDRALIGAPNDDATALNSGAVHLFKFDTFTPGLVADTVRVRAVDPNSITTSSLQDGSVTAAKLDPTIGIWTRADTNVYRLTGRVGIGTATPAFTLEVNGTAGKPGGGSWTSTSDERLKKSIHPLAGALDRLLALRGVSFEYVDPEKINELSGERMGLVAQEVEKVFPDWVQTGPDGYKRITVRGLEALVVEALRELQQQNVADIRRLNQELAEELERRAAEDAELKQRLDALEKAIRSQRSK